jgi:hypothetical protein
MSGILMLADEQWLAFQRRNSRGRKAIFYASPSKKINRQKGDPLFCVRRGSPPRPIVAVGHILEQIVIHQDDAWRKYGTELGAATEEQWLSQAAAVLQKSRDNFDGEIRAIVLIEFSFFSPQVSPNEVGLDDTGWQKMKNVPDEPMRLLLDRLVTSPLGNEKNGKPSSHGTHFGALSEETYYRDSPERLKEIIPRHNKLSNDICDWLKTVHGIIPYQEQQWIDVRFKLHGHDVIAELKVCAYVGTRKSIREALGQLLEYNHYPSRTPAQLWLIVIDEEPSPDDKDFIDALRADRALPISIGWRTNGGFDFRPPWPESPA